MYYFFCMLSLTINRKYNWLVQLNHRFLFRIDSSCQCEKGNDDTCLLNNSDMIQGKIYKWKLITINVLKTWMQLIFLADEIKERVRLADLSTLMTADLVVSVSILCPNPVISLSAELCVSDYLSCLHTIPIMVNYELEETDCFTGKLEYIMIEIFFKFVQNFIINCNEVLRINYSDA